MLTLKRRRKRRVLPRRGRGAILGLFFCFAQCSIPAEEWLDLEPNLEENFEVMESHLCQTEG